MLIFDSTHQILTRVRCRSQECDSKINFSYKYDLLKGALYSKDKNVHLIYSTFITEQAKSEGIKVLERWLLRRLISKTYETVLSHDDSLFNHLLQS